LKLSKEGIPRLWKKMSLFLPKVWKGLSRAELVLDAILFVEQWRPKYTCDCTTSEFDSKHILVIFEVG